MHIFKDIFKNLKSKTKNEETVAVNNTTQDSTIITSFHDDKVTLQNIKSHVENTSTTVFEEKNAGAEKSFQNKRYRNWMLIGEGGQGATYKVYDNALNQEIAIKTLHTKYSNNKLLIEGLKNEVIISRKLRHPGIAGIYDIVNFQEGNIGITMEYIDGISLRTWVKDKIQDSFDNYKDFLLILYYLSEGLSVGHSNGVIHRDIKPDNIILRNGEKKNPVILDFGIAIPTIESPDGVRCGTPKYMPPEQYNAPNKVTFSSDLFSIGIMIYEFFTGTLPPCSLQQIIRTNIVPQITIDELPLLSSFNNRIPESLDKLVYLLLAYEPENRLSSAEKLCQKLSELVLIEEKKNFGKVFVDFNKLRNENEIVRFIEFSPEYYQSGMSILSYFGKILWQKYPNKNVKVRIEQNDLKVKMIIDTPEGNKEEIEKALKEYSSLTRRLKRSNVLLIMPHKQFCDVQNI